MVDFNLTMQIITLNANDLNTPIEQQNCCLDKKQYPTIYCLQETHFKHKERDRLKNQI